MALTDAIPQINPLQLAAQDRTIYHLTLQAITSLSDTNINAEKAIGDIYMLNAASEKRPVYWDGTAFQKVLRSDYDEVLSGQWSFSPGVARTPFLLGTNAYDQLVSRFNADLVDGKHADAALTNNTIPIRDASGRIKAADPSAIDDVATKGWTETLTQGFKGRGEARVAFTANFASTMASNVLTATSNGSINSSGITDGVTNLALNNEVLLVNQTTQAHNGKYFVSQVGDAGNPAKLTRTTNMDQDAEVSNGISVLVNEGTINAGSSWALSTTGTITLNTTALVWQVFARAGNYAAGNGMVKVGLTFHAIQSAAYTTGAMVWASGTATLALTGALSGLLMSNGASGPGAVTGLTADALPRYKGASPWLQDSCLIDNGTVLTTSRAFKPNADGTMDLGASGGTWKDFYSKSATLNNGVNGTGVIHLMLQAGSPSKNRWGLGLRIAETGSSNTGSDMILNRYDDAGGLLGEAVRIKRSNGYLSINTTQQDERVCLNGGIAVVQSTSGTGASPSEDANGFFYLSGTGTSKAGMFFRNEYNDNFGAWLVLKTNPVGGAGAVERMFISPAGDIGVGTAKPLGTLDLGSATAGKSIVWGGATGANHYLSIGSAYSSGSMLLLRGLHANTAADDVRVSWTGTMAHAGVRIGGTSGEADIYLFAEPPNFRTRGDFFDWNAYGKWRFTGATGLAEFNPGTTPSAGLLLNMAPLAAAGTKDSHSLNCRARSYDTASHSIEWRQFVLSTSNAGASSFVLEKSFDGGSWSRMLQLTDNAELKNLRMLSSEGLGNNVDLDLRATGSVRSYVDTDGDTSGAKWSWFATSTEVATMSKSGSLRLGDSTAPTARLHPKAGVATAGGAPLKFDSGVLLTSAEQGSMEYDGAQIYFSRASTATRCAMVLGRSFLVGDGTNATITLTHNLGTQNVVPLCVRVSDNQVVGGPKVVASAADSVTLTFSGVPTTNQYRVILLSCGI